MLHKPPSLLALDAGVCAKLWDDSAALVAA
jgi:hypothetical protein